MARLREQRNIVRELVDYQKNVPLTDHNYLQRIVSASDGTITREDLVNHCDSIKIFLADKKEVNFEEKVKGIGKMPPEPWDLDRISKIQTLLQSCIGDGFIEPVINELTVPDGSWHKLKTIRAETGLRATSKGTDLLTFIGLCNTWLEKNSNYKYVFGSIGTIIVFLTIQGGGSFIFHHIHDFLCYLHGTVCK